MKTKLSEADIAFRLAESKATMRKKAADADEKRSYAAKEKFKNAKKTWKLARKKAKRSSKIAKLARKNLLTLSKHLKKMEKKSEHAKPSATTTSKPAKRSTGHKKRTSNSISSESLKTAGEGPSNPPSGSVAS